MLKKYVQNEHDMVIHEIEFTSAFCDMTLHLVPLSTLMLITKLQSKENKT